MPELPEVEITARRLSAALAGVEVESAQARGMVALKSIDPPLSALEGRSVSGVRRVGKMPVVEFAPTDGTADGIAMLVHMMSAGRLQLFDKRASLRDRASRVLVRLTDGRELRLREFGTKQRAWAKLMPAGDVESDEMVATLGPEAWPEPAVEELARRIDEPRHLHPMLRDQRVVAGIGNVYKSKILFLERVNPWTTVGELDDARLRGVLATAERLLRANAQPSGGPRITTTTASVAARLWVYARAGRPCFRCRSLIQARRQGKIGRLTYWCPTCQSPAASRPTPAGSRTAGR
jgi:formamidopyrimidine-DNA glycosylase